MEFFFNLPFLVCVAVIEKSPKLRHVPIFSDRLPLSSELNSRQVCKILEDFLTNSFLGGCSVLQSMLPRRYGNLDSFWSFS